MSIRSRRRRLALTLVLSSLLWSVIAGRASGEQVNDSPWNRERPTDTRVDSLWSVWYGGGIFLASAGDGTVLVSTGAEWHRETLVPAIIPNDMLYVDGHFVGVGTHDNEGVFISSLNGTEWAVQSVPGEEMPAQIAYGDGLFVAIAPSSMYTSTDAVTWQRHDSPLPPTLTLITVAYGNGQFVVIAHAPAQPGNPNAFHIALTSRDGIDWVQHPIGELPLIGTAAFGAGRFVVAGLRNTILTSEDGVTWVERLGHTPNYWISDVVFGDDRFVATSRFGQVLISTDGTAWTYQAVDGVSDFTGVAYGSGRFVVTGDTPDLYSWNKACGAFFTDVSANDPACDALTELTSRHLVSGFPDATFRPLASITRAEVAKLLALSLGLRPDPTTQLAFSDTAGHWVVTGGLLQPLVQASIVTGFPDGSFRPDQPVTRAELVSLVVAAAGLGRSGTQPFYADMTDSLWYYDRVAAALEGHLIGPDGAYPVWTESLLQGSEIATRAEAAALLANLLRYQPPTETQPN